MRCGGCGIVTFSEQFIVSFPGLACGWLEGGSQKNGKIPNWQYPCHGGTFACPSEERAKVHGTDMSTCSISTNPDPLTESTRRVWKIDLQVSRVCWGSLWATASDTTRHAPAPASLQADPKIDMLADVR